MRTLNKATLDMIKSFEGLRLVAYNDMINVPTIGWGHTRGVTHADVTAGRTITQAEAEAMLADDLAEHQAAVEKLVTVPINDNQYGALVSFSFNLGDESLRTSHLLSMLNAGDSSGAADQFLRWDHAGGVQVAGLTHRRQAERSLFLQSVPSAGVLGDGPTQEEIEKKLQDIENDV